MDKFYTASKDVNGVTISMEYTGGWPSLCCGTLIIHVDAERFEGSIVSGGRAYFTNHYAESHITHGEWDVSMNNDFMSKYEKYLPDVIELVNETIPEGCCGGCL